MGEDLRRLRILGAKVDDCTARSDGVSCNRDPFEQPERVILKQSLIAECARIALISVDDDDWFATGVSHGPPLLTGRETCATAAAQSGLRHFFDNG